MSAAGRPRKSPEAVAAAIDLLTSWTGFERALPKWERSPSYRTWLGQLKRERRRMRELMATDVEVFT